jgi:hypothetical protein
MDNRWVIFYGDGTTFGFEDGSVEDAPGWDVQAIAWDDEQVGHVVQSRDYYWIEDGEWTGGDLISLLQWLVGSGQVKVGRFTSNSRWDEITAEARRYVDAGHLRRKSAWRPDERH